MAFASSKDGFSFASESAAFVDYYFIAGGTMDGCVAGMRQLTGPSPMLPRWAYGFWQSRERYKTQDEIVSVLKRCRADGIPLDGIVQDWQYWGGNAHWNDMKFDSRTFPDPKKMVDDIHALHAKVLITVWPSFGPKTDAVGLGHLQDLDLTGWNYRALYRIMRAKYPEKPTLYSEAAASLSTFGYYEPDLPSVKHHYGSTGQTDVTSYDLGAEDWSDIPDVDLDRERTDKYLCGQFIWSGIDYLGEPCVHRAVLNALPDILHKQRRRNGCRETP